MVIPLKTTDFYSFFSYDDWLPSVWKLQFASTEECMVALEASKPIPAALVLFWQLLDPFQNKRLVGSPLQEMVLDKVGLDESATLLVRKALQDALPKLRERESSTGLLGRIPKLLALLDAEIHPDDPVDEVVLYPYLHLAASLSLRLETVDGEQTERFWEVVENALRLSKRQVKGTVVPWYDQGDFNVDFSFRLVQVYLWCRLFHYCQTNGDPERALECLANAARCSLSNKCDFEQLLEDGAIWAELIEEGMERSPGIACGGSGQHLVSVLVSAQDAADAFRNIIDHPNSSYSWKAVSSYCYQLRDLWGPSLERVITTTLSPEPEPARDFWLLAHGASQQRMSPSEFVAALEEARKRESEKRLTAYCFPHPLWSRVPDQDRRSLVSADREYEATGGQKSAIPHHLREATATLLLEKMIRPYHQATEVRNAATELRALLNEFKDDDFWRSCTSRFGKEASRYLRSVEEQLYELDALANDDRHHNRSSSKLVPDAMRMYRSFLGLGAPGILPSIVGWDPIRKA